jgi:hypothetical protein
MRSVSIFLALIAVSTAVAAQDAIKDVDFKNFTFEPYCIGEAAERVTVKDGKFFAEKQEEGYVDRYYFSIFEVAYGDLTGDGSDEAVVLSVCNTGGTGNFTEGYVNGIIAGKPALLARIPGGDRADGGLRSARVEMGVLIVESNDPELGGACCPEYIITAKYRVQGGKLIGAGSPVRREIYPSERLRFARGTSGTTFRVTIAPDEGRRYMVGARAGQVLTVSADSEHAGLRLLEDASLTYGINNFLARLPKSGDYTVEIRNNSEKTMEFVVNIKIR